MHVAAPSVVDSGTELEQVAAHTPDPAEAEDAWVLEEEELQQQQERAVEHVSSVLSFCALALEPSAPPRRH